MTEAGKALKTVINVFAKLAMTQTAMAELKDYPRGPLQVATTLSFGSIWLAPRLQEFLDQYPRFRDNLFLKDEEIDLNMREADIGITALLSRVQILFIVNLSLIVFAFMQADLI